MTKQIKNSYLLRARSRVLILSLILIFCAVSTGATFDTAAKKVTVNEINKFTGEKKSSVITTRRDSVGQFFAESKIALSEYDNMNVKNYNAVEDGMSITIERGVPVTLKTAEGEKTVGVTSTTVSEAAAELGYDLSGDEYETDSALDAPVSKGSVITVKKITYEDVSFDEEIPFDERSVNDDSMLVGQTSVVSEGECGIRQKVYRVRYIDGVEDYGVQISESITKQPVDRVIAYGTLEKAVNVKETKGIASGALASRGVMRYKTKLTMSATAYDTSAGQNGGYARTAIGLVPDIGVVAVDPSVIPLGSRLYIESTDDGNSWVYGYAIAGDTGGAIKGNRIDLCYRTNSQCMSFGRRQATVYVLE